MIDFKSTYSRDEILDFLKNSFIKDFQKDVRIVDVPEQKYIQEAHSLGYAPELELSVFEFLHEGGTEKRVTLTKEAFNVLRDSGSFKAIGIFHSKDTDDWRFSLMTATPTRNEKNKVQIILSNPKRYSFLLGPNAKVNTPTKFLITKGEIQNFEDLKERFSIEVVNKEFYKEISKLFIQLVGGTLGKGRSEEEYKALLRLPGVKDSSQTAQEFAVRLIGRLIFCWFLREKRNGSEESLMPHSLLSLEASKNNKNYYHGVLEPIFFKVLNVPLSSRKDEEFSTNPYDKIPYLNGGLFSPHDDDFYSTNESKQENNNEEVVVPDKWLQELFEILETYNFTIDENSAFDEELSIDPEMLGRIFENLLAEINPETGESARKSTGSYYTPRVIVDYMVDESLYLYLYNKTEIEEEKLRSLISYDLDDDSFTPLTEDEKEKIITAIDELKILDPACGSGAFPMGALQKIVFILQQLDPNGQYWFKAQIKNVPVELRKNLEREHSEKNFDYIRKLGVIRRNIFGVDIQPIATEISRLRCFLTLIVDQKVDDNKDNRGIDPLPNLDFKFVTANSLISLPEKENSKETIGMFEDTNRINELKDIRDQFFNASNFERIELKDQFRKIQLEMSKYYNSVKSAGAELTEMLLSWDPFSHKMTGWFDPEWMFGIKDGFDIVIGNPPYFSISKLKNKDAKEAIRKEGFEVFSNSIDIYCLFYEKAVSLTSKIDGIVTFITSNKWMRATYGEKLRDFLIQRDPVVLIDLGPGIFKSATVDTNILIMREEELHGNEKLKAAKILKYKEGNFGRLVSDLANTIVAPSGSPWLVLGREEFAIKEKTEKIGCPLSQFQIKINRGILTGYNKAFFIDEKKRNQLIEQDPNSEEIIVPILKGRDIKRHGYDWDGRYIILTGYDLNIPTKYPAIFEHLERYEEKLQKRGDKGVNWWNLRACTYYDEMRENKIIYPETASTNNCYLDNKGFVIDKTAFFITGKDIEFLYGILFSNPFTYFYKTFGSGTDLSHTGFQYNKHALLSMNVPTRDDVGEDVYSEIVNLVRKLYSHNTSISEIQEEIDLLVCKAYQINEKERNLIKESVY